MPSLERFFDPQMRKFDANVRPLPGARLYFFENGTTTPKSVYKDKQGAVAHDNPVIADSTGVFAQIFLDGLYRVELRSSSNIVQPGWPIDNIGQDTPVVPFGPWSEINTYNTGEIVTASNGDWYRSISDDNLGNDPLSSPSYWEIIPIPVASSYTSNKAYLTWADDGDQISLNVDTAGLVDEIEANIDEIDGNLNVAGTIDVTGKLTAIDDIEVGNDLILGGFPIKYYEQDKAADGSFTSGTIKFSRIGRCVTISGNNLIHPSGSAPSCLAGFVPVEYRPTNTQRNICDVTGTIKEVSIDFIGTFTVRYYDFAGLPVSQTAIPSFTVSYNI